ncbi:ORF17 [Fowl aviadenovirus 4]|nr:ORF17 [Fowl aviadenovirus 4]
MLPPSRPSAPCGTARDTTDYHRASTTPGTESRYLYKKPNAGTVAYHSDTSPTFP